MVKFSVGRLEDGEGSSTRYAKKQRTDRQFQANYTEEDETASVEIYQVDEEDDEQYQEFPFGFLEDDEDDDEVQEREDEEQAVNNSCNEEMDDPTEPGREGSISVTLTDPEVFDCPICCEPLSTPVFQCENGHTACSSCCTKLMNKCPSCCLPIGYNRCRAIEKVLESIKVICQNMKYGCKETMSFSKKHDHAKTCHHAPCSCPFPDCNFVGSYSQLSKHFSDKHENSAIQFKYDRVLQITLNVNEGFLVLQEEMDSILFILNNSTESLGNVISVSCIAPSSKGAFFYDIRAKPEGSILRFQSFTKSIQSRVNNPPSTGFLLVPTDSFGSSGQLKLDLCIWRQCVSPKHISGIIN